MMKNVRLSRRGGGTNPIEHGAQETAAHGGAKGRSPDLKAPMKTRPFETYPQTGIPLASEYSRESGGSGPFSGNWNAESKKAPKKG